MSGSESPEAAIAYSEKKVQASTGKERLKQVWGAGCWHAKKIEGVDFEAACSRIAKAASSDGWLSEETARQRYTLGWEKGLLERGQPQPPPMRAHDARPRPALSASDLCQALDDSEVQKRVVQLLLRAMNEARAQREGRAA